MLLIHILNVVSVPFDHRRSRLRATWAIAHGGRGGVRRLRGEGRGRSRGTLGPPPPARGEATTARYSQPNQTKPVIKNVSARAVRRPVIIHRSLRVVACRRKCSTWIRPRNRSVRPPTSAAIIAPTILFSSVNNDHFHFLVLFNFRVDNF